MKKKNHCHHCKVSPSSSGCRLLLTRREYLKSRDRWWGAAITPDDGGWRSATRLQHSLWGPHHRTPARREDQACWPLRRRVDPLQWSRCADRDWRGDGVGGGSGVVNGVRDCQGSSRIHLDDCVTFYRFITSAWHFQPLLLLSPPSLVRLVRKKSWRKALRREFRLNVSNYARFIKGREDGLVGNHMLINRMSARATLSGCGNSKSASFYPPRVLKLGLKNKSVNYNETCQLSRLLRLGEASKKQTPPSGVNVLTFPNSSYWARLCSISLLCLVGTNTAGALGHIIVLR